MAPEAKKDCLLRAENEVETGSWSFCFSDKSHRTPSEKCLTALVADLSQTETTEGGTGNHGMFASICHFTTAAAYRPTLQLGVGVGAAMTVDEARVGVL